MLKDLIWEYLGVISFMEDNPGIYGTDDRRCKLHEQIEKYFKGKEKDLKTVLHNLQKWFDAELIIKFANDIEYFKECMMARNIKIIPEID